jgi:hypothetical protein
MRVHGKARSKCLNGHGSIVIVKSGWTAIIRCPRISVRKGNMIMFYGFAAAMVVRRPAPDAMCQEAPAIRLVRPACPCQLRRPDGDQP